MSEEIKNSKIKSKIYFPIKVKDLKGYTFRIPIYQRKYAWKETDIEQLFKDLKEAENSHFIGNIVVEEVGPKIYDVIDGQQRLTTLFLIGLLGKQEDFFELSYKVRENDKKFLDKLKEEEVNESVVEKLDKEFDPDDQMVANIKTILQEGDKENISKAEFALTVLKSNEVDIAKYFEVMNSRGKQLEQHQVLKAKFLQCIEKECHAIYAKLWDYCSMMDVYIEDVIYQYEKRKYDNKSKQSKPTVSKEKLRLELLEFAINSEKEKVKKFFDKTQKTKKEDFITISKALKHDADEEKNYEGVSRYRSFVKFEYFLLHILRLYLEKKGESVDDVELKDSKLIEQYENKLSFLKKPEDNNDAMSAKSFLGTLFRYRILYDNFFFKRFISDDEPFVAKLGVLDKGIDIDRYSEKKPIRQILNMQLLFNFTGDFYAQHWIQSVLRWISNNEKLKNFEDPEDFYCEYAHFLDGFDRSIMNARLANDDLQNKYLNFEESHAPKDLDAPKLKYHLHKGTSTQHYWFYRLDYVLWRDFKWEKGIGFKEPFQTNEKFKYENIPGEFRLSRLNSIEHIMPQSRKNEWDGGEECGDCPNKEEKRLDCFGNLALISQHMNSALSDESENKKSLIQRQLNRRGTIESLKMLIFYSNIHSSTDITLRYCKEHQVAMIEYLCDKEREAK